MARERLRHSLPDALIDVVSDFADLFRRELRLARAEMSSNLSAKLRGSVWLIIAGLLGLLTLALILGALVAWITTFDVSLHSAFLIVAAVMGALAALTYLAGYNEAQGRLLPSRTMRNLEQDIETTKEQLT